MLADLEARREFEAMKFYGKLATIVSLVILLSCIVVAVVKADDYTDDQIANAIYKAEGGPKTNYPYGILTKYKHTTPRQACINTIKSARKRFAKQIKEKDFIHFLSLTYCPIGCENDNGTNKYWVKNVKYFLNKG